MGPLRIRREDFLHQNDASHRKDQINQGFFEKRAKGTLRSLVQYFLPYSVKPVFKRQMICKDLGISELLFELLFFMRKNF